MGAYPDMLLIHSAPPVLTGCPSCCRRQGAPPAADPPGPHRLLQGWRASLSRSLAPIAVTPVSLLVQRFASPGRGMDGYALGA